MTLEEIEVLARQLIKEHNPYIKFQWSNTKNAYGDYTYQLKTIRLSKVLAPHMAESQVREVIFHEIAHSLCSEGEGHGPYWAQLMRNKFNLEPNPCTDFTGDWLKVPGLWYAVCSQGHSIKSTWARKPTANRSCPQCSPVYNKAYKLEYRQIA